MSLSKRTYDEGKRYETVVFQENTHPADFEMVELQDIQNQERRSLVTSLLTDGAIGNGFLVVGSGLTNAVNITPGAVFSQGDRILLPDSQHVTVLNQFVYNMPVATPVVDRTDLIYLDIFVDDVTSAQDPNIEDPALGPSAYRERISYAISLAEGTTAIPALPTGHRGVALAQIARHGGVATIAAADVTDVRPVAGLSTQFSPKNLIIVSQTGGQFSDVQAALDSITGNSATNQFVVLVGPGTYVSKTPIVLNKSYVSLTGIDAVSTTVRVYQATGNFQAFTIAANNVTVENISLDIGTGSAGNTTVVGVSTGVQGAAIVNCIIGQHFFNDSGTNNLQGVLVNSGASVNIARSVIYAENYGAGLANAGGTVGMSLSSITAMFVDAVDNSGTFTVGTSNILSNNRSLNSINFVLASRTSFTTDLVNGNAGTTANCMLLTGTAANLMKDCAISSNINRIDVNGPSLDWQEISSDTTLFLSGAGSSSFTRCIFTAVEASGTDASFFGCTVSGGSNGTDTVGLAIRAGTTSEISSCVNTGNNAVIADNANPVISNCSFRSIGAVDLIDITNGAKPVIANCSFYIEDSASAKAISILDTVSNPTLVNNFFQGPFAGSSPAIFVYGVVGSQLLRGQNTASQGITLFSPNITTTNLLTSGNRHVDLTDMPDSAGTNADHDVRFSIGAGGGVGTAHNKAILASTASGQGASLVGVKTGSNIVATNVQSGLEEIKGEIITARGAAANLDSRLSTSMNSAGYILSTGMNNLRVHATSTPGTQVNVEPGSFQKTDGSAIVTTSLALSAGFTPVLTLGHSRIDLLSINDAGALAITVGTEAASPVPPAYPSGVIVLAEITVTFGASPVILDANIKDARPFLRALPPLVTQVGNSVKSNLVVKSDATTPNSIVNVSADIISVQGIILGDGSTNSISLSADITTTGANGRDAAHSLTASTWYGVFLITNNNGSLYASYFVRASEIAALPANLPAGYTLFRRVGWARVDASSHIINFTGIGRDVYFNTSPLITISTPGAGQSLAVGVPPTSQIVHIQASVTTPPGSRQGTQRPTGAAYSPIILMAATNLGGSGSITVDGNFTLQTSSSQQIDFASIDQVTILGYVDDV